MDVFGAIISVLSCLCKEIGRKHNNLKNINKDMETLKREMKYLSGKEDDVKTKLQRGDQQLGMKCKREVKVLLEQIENLQNEVDSLLDKEKLGCQNGELCCYYSRLELSGRVKEKIKEAIDVQEKIKSFEDHEIPTMELVKYWVYDGLISEARNSEVEIDKGYDILNELKNACLLERIDNRSGAEFVKMHDLIRDMAIIITRVSPLFIVKPGVDLEELPHREESMENVERISLTNNNIQVLAGEPKCPKLSTLWLQHNRYLKNISPSFFEHMKSLRVLNLSYTRIKCLPESLSNLENLRALLLHYCFDLKTMSPVTNLKLLRFLDLNYTGIELLPQGMEGLVNLRHLNLSRTFSLNILPIGVIRNLSLLEELYMSRSKYSWSLNSLQVEGGASIEEIINSTHLTDLHVHLVDLPSFDAYVKSEQWQKLESFYLIVGRVTDLLPPDTSKMKYIVEIGGCHIVDCERPLVLPSNTQYLAIENCNDIVGLSELPCLSHLNELKECHISRCDALRLTYTMYVPEAFERRLREEPSHRPILLNGG
ncbi:hypothetical protein AAC387_Pa10g0843 [Persea americana]